MKHTLVALMEDKPGVLNRAVNMFSRRAFNIESLTVGHTELPHLSRSYAGQPIVALDPPDEERALWHARLLARHSFREPRRPNWRHQRAARELFHKLWGMHGMGAKYEKPVWNTLQQELNKAGVRM